MQCRCFVEKLNHFTDHVTLIDKMFKELVLSTFQNIDIDLQTIRIKYDLGQSNDCYLEKIEINSENDDEINLQTNVQEPTKLNQEVAIKNEIIKLEENLSISQSVKKRRKMMLF